MFLLTCVACVGGASFASADTEVRLREVLAHLRSECLAVEAALNSEEPGDMSRADQLVRFARSSAATGRFGVSAAGYATFLDEFGFDHPYSVRALQRLGDSLAPLDLENIETIHTASGPQCRPSWRFRVAPSAERLEVAANVHELAARLLQRPEHRQGALFNLGWIHRTRQAWEASTTAWKRCADHAKTPLGERALWRAAENLAWTGLPGEAAALLRRLMVEHPNSRRKRAAQDLSESYAAEAARTDTWFADPLASFKSEIAVRSGDKSPEQVYRCVAGWLQRRGKSRELIVISRWATTQRDWSMSGRITVCHQLVDRLLQPGADEAAKREAATVLGDVMTFAVREDWIIAAGLRRARLLSELRDFAAADGVLATIELRFPGTKRWSLPLTVERIHGFVDRGDNDAARSLYEILKKTYPDYPLPPDVQTKLERIPKGGAR